jgi:hypothetical protein
LNPVLQQNKIVPYFKGFLSWPARSPVTILT